MEVSEVSGTLSRRVSKRSGRRENFPVRRGEVWVAPKERSDISKAKVENGTFYPEG
jgi:hypothetical protein